MRDPGSIEPKFNLWVGKIPWRREWLPTLVFLSGELHGQRSLVGYEVAKSQTQLSTFHSLHTNVKAKILTKTMRAMI